MGSFVRALLVACTLLAAFYDGVESQKPGGIVPAGYTKFPGVGTYKFHPYGSNWHDALRACEKEGAEMLIVNSATEAEVIKKLFKSNKKVSNALNANHVWIGAREKGVHGTFYTNNNGEDLRGAGYLNWAKAPQQPNDRGTEDCVSFYSSGTMYDDACHLLYPFVCELKL